MEKFSLTRALRSLFLSLQIAAVKQKTFKVKKHLSSQFFLSVSTVKKSLAGNESMRTKKKDKVIK